MAKRKKLKRVLVLGSGALKIGEAGEFDYSGSQALKALREEGIRTVLVNPNIATIQTSEKMADEIYFLPVEPEFVSGVIEKERPDGILLGFGGQTALNCGLALYKSGILKKYGVRVLGTPVQTIITTEDRGLFKKAVGAVGLSTPKSAVARSETEARRAAREIGYPLILRGAYSLGGRGSTVVASEKELVSAAKKILRFVPQFLVEEYLQGWKEIEYEIVRDGNDNCIAVCNMENIDPMGIHTGESIVVAPSQTLDNREYHMLRSHAVSLVRSLGVIGECNVQFALDAKSDDYRVIEVNARLSRSSALASKATGYPLAYIAAKIGLGYTLPELKNSVTKTTSAFFEPAMDYVVVKIPRWDLKKFHNVSKKIGPEMKSVGEVMAIGRSFEEAFQKAIRMLNVGAAGFEGDGNYVFKNIRRELRVPTDERIFAIAAALSDGISIKEIARLTSIDPWFIGKMKNIVDAARNAKRSKLSEVSLRQMKERGFSDTQIGKMFGVSEAGVRAKRFSHGIVPAVKQIDTLAAEYPAKTNYFYTTYQSQESDVISSKRSSKKVMVIGSGPYKIGSSIEFDWCAVNAVRTLRSLGFETIMLNCNPETVSTDYDECDRLYFEEPTLERVLDIYEKEKPTGVVLSVGGQIPNTLALGLEKAGVKILGTSAQSIHRAEDRQEFSKLLDLLGVPQPRWMELTSFDAVKKFAHEVSYPVLVRPSYVLSGAAMGVAFNEAQLDTLLHKALTEVNHAHPVVVSKFVTGAKEIEIDAVANKGEIIASALTEHIENAGVHSGDATIVFPAQKVYEETEKRCYDIVQQIARSLRITGPLNIQFLAKNNEVMVIECNLRASRSLPFVSKALDVNFIDLAIRAMMGKKVMSVQSRRPPYVVVKAPQFSFARLYGSDPALSVEMSSTGEVGCFGDTLEEAFLKSIFSVGFRTPKKNILLSLGGDQNKSEFLESAKQLKKSGFALFATPRTASYLARYGISASILQKPSQKRGASVKDWLQGGRIDLCINTSDEGFPENIPDDYSMRRTAVDFNVPLITNIQLAKLFVSAFLKLKRKEIGLSIKPRSAYQ